VNCALDAVFARPVDHLLCGFTVFDRAKTDFKSGTRILRQNAEKELGDLAHSPAEALTVLNVMLTVAEADGEIEPAELTALERSAKLLGLNLKDHL